MFNCFTELHLLQLKLKLWSVPSLNYREKKLTLVQCLERQLPSAPGGDEVGEGYRECLRECKGS